MPEKFLDMHKAIPYNSTNCIELIGYSFGPHKGEAFPGPTVIEELAAFPDALAPTLALWRKAVD